MKPRLMPNLSSRTLAVVARQFVVQDALEMIRCLAGSYAFSLTPSTTVTSGSLAGAVMMTFLAPAWRCLEAVAVSRKMPVDSTTTSTPSSFQGRLAGSFSAVTRTSRPLTKMAPSLALTSAGRLPCTESCLSRWASVLASARSLTPTTTISFSFRAVRKRPRPREPTGFHAATQARGQPLGDQPRLIEPALALTGAAQGNGHQRVHVGGQAGAALRDHQIGQRTSERPPLLELERVKRVAERALVTCGRARVVPH